MARPRRTPTPPHQTHTSDPTQAQRPITVTSRADATVTRNTAVARRLERGVFSGGRAPIPLKEPGRWYIREANSQVHDERFREMRHRLGYEPLTAADLACEPEEIGYRVSADGYLVRGQHGDHMLFKMSLEDRRLIDQAKTDANMKGIGSAAKTKFDLANAAGAALGSEAADFLHGMPGDVIDRLVTE